MSSTGSGSNPKNKWLHVWSQLKTVANKELHELQSKKETYLQDMPLPAQLSKEKAAQLSDYLFDFKKHWDESKQADILRQFPVVKTYHDFLVPDQVSSKDFWLRYGWRCDKQRIVKDLEQLPREDFTKLVEQLTEQHEEAKSRVYALPSKKVPAVHSAASSLLTPERQSSSSSSSTVYDRSKILKRRSQETELGSPKTPVKSAQDINPMYMAVLKRNAQKARKTVANEQAAEAAKQQATEAVPAVRDEPTSTKTTTSPDETKVVEAPVPAPPPTDQNVEVFKATLASNEAAKERPSDFLPGSLEQAPVSPRRASKQTGAKWAKDASTRPDEWLGSPSKSPRKSWTPKSPSPGAAKKAMPVIATLELEQEEDGVESSSTSQPRTAAAASSEAEKQKEETQDAPRIKAEQAAAEAAQMQADQDATEAARVQVEQEAARIKAEREAAKAARVQAERVATEAAQIQAEAVRVQAEQKPARIKAEQETASFMAEQDAAEEPAEAARVQAEQVAAEAAQIQAEQDAAEAVRAQAEHAAAKLVQMQTDQEAAKAVRVQAEQEAAHIKAEPAAAEAAQIQAEQEAAEVVQHVAARIEAEQDAAAYQVQLGQESAEAFRVQSEQEAARLKEAEQDAADAAQIQAEQEAEQDAAEAAKMQSEEVPAEAAIALLEQEATVIKAEQAAAEVTQMQEDQEAARIKTTQDAADAAQMQPDQAAAEVVIVQAEPETTVIVHVEQEVVAPAASMIATVEAADTQNVSQAQGETAEVEEKAAVTEAAGLQAVKDEPSEDEPTFAQENEIVSVVLDENNDLDAISGKSDESDGIIKDDAESHREDTRQESAEMTEASTAKGLHLVNLNQPLSGYLSDDDSLGFGQLFDTPKGAPPEKPLLAAAIKAREKAEADAKLKVDSGPPPALGEVVVVESELAPLDEVDGAEEDDSLASGGNADLDESREEDPTFLDDAGATNTTATKGLHLANLNQPLSGYLSDDDSLGFGQLFDTSKGAPPEKPLLAAAIKAREKAEADAKLKVDSGPPPALEEVVVVESELVPLDELDGAEEDDSLASGGNADLDESREEDPTFLDDAGATNTTATKGLHLANLNQPLSGYLSDDDSLGFGQLFDTPKGAPPEKPLLAAAIKAREKAEAEAKQIRDPTKGDHLAKLNQPIESTLSDDDSLGLGSLFDAPRGPPPDKPLLAAAIKAREQAEAAEKSRLKGGDPSKGDHLAKLHQPILEHDNDGDSIGSGELFDGPKGPAPFEALAVLKARAKEKMKNDNSSTGQDSEKNDDNEPNDACAQQDDTIQGKTLETAPSAVESTDPSGVMSPTEKLAEPSLLGDSTAIPPSKSSNEMVGPSGEPQRGKLTDTKEENAPTLPSPGNISASDEATSGQTPLAPDKASLLAYLSNSILSPATMTKIGEIIKTKDQRKLEAPTNNSPALCGGVLEDSKITTTLTSSPSNLAPQTPKGEFDIGDVPSSTVASEKATENVSPSSVGAQSKQSNSKVNSGVRSFSNLFFGQSTPKSSLDTEKEEKKRILREKMREMDPDLEEALVYQGETQQRLLKQAVESSLRQTRSIDASVDSSQGKTFGGPDAGKSADMLKLLSEAIFSPNTLHKTLDLERDATKNLIRDKLKEMDIDLDDVMDVQAATQELLIRQTKAHLTAPNLADEAPNNSESALSSVDVVQKMEDYEELDMVSLKMDADSRKNAGGSMPNLLTKLRESFSRSIPNMGLSLEEEKEKQMRLLREGLGEELSDDIDVSLSSQRKIVDAKMSSITDQSGSDDEFALEQHSEPLRSPVIEEKSQTPVAESLPEAVSGSQQASESDQPAAPEQALEAFSFLELPKKSEDDGNESEYADSTQVEPGEAEVEARMKADDEPARLESEARAQANAEEEAIQQSQDEEIRLEQEYLLRQQAEDQARVQFDNEDYRRASEAQKQSMAEENAQNLISGLDQTLTREQEARERAEEAARTAMGQSTSEGHELPDSSPMQVSEPRQDGGHQAAHDGYSKSTRLTFEEREEKRQRVKALAHKLLLPEAKQA